MLELPNLNKVQIWLEKKFNFFSYQDLLVNPLLIKIEDFYKQSNGKPLLFSFSLLVKKNV